jgi:hypothetical protein
MVSKTMDVDSSKDCRRRRTSRWHSDIEIDFGAAL